MVVYKKGGMPESGFLPPSTSLTATMPWDKYTLRLFGMIPKDPDRFDFHGPYNRLLFSFFPIELDAYMVAPYSSGKPRIVNWQ